jgi:hypothetical protein
MTVAPPLEVSTQAKLVFPAHRSLATQTVGADCCPEDSRRGEERCAHARFLTGSHAVFLTGSHAVLCRSPTTKVGSYLLLAAFMRRHPWNFQVNFQVKRACRAPRNRDEDETGGTLLAARLARASSRRSVA